MRVLKMLNKQQNEQQSPYASYPSYYQGMIGGARLSSNALGQKRMPVYNIYHRK